MPTKRKTKPNRVQPKSVPAQAPEAKRAVLAALADAQGIKPIADPLAMKGGFWPPDESVDDFVEAIRTLRCQGRTTPPFLSTVPH